MPRTAKKTDDADFDHFWAAYPRHDGKLAAQRKWHSLKPSPDLVQRILSALTWQCRLERWQDPEFVPMARTYLHQARWEDEPPRPRTAPTPAPAPAWHCPHRDECPSRWICQKASLLNKPLKAVAS